MSSNNLIIVAAGKGERMKHNVPKQFLLLNNVPILVHTINSFTDCMEDLNVVVVLHPEYLQEWHKIYDQYGLQQDITAIEGGPTRFDSVKNGLSYVQEDGVTAIHDGVRPFASSELIKKCYSAAAEEGTAVPFIQQNQSIRELTRSGSKSVDRKKILIVQTPQCFHTTLIQNAYDNSESSNFTDDASLIESQGTEINLIPGEERNIKITTPIDYELAQVMMRVDSASI